MSNWFAWAGSALATLLLAIILIQPLTETPSSIPNTDYIAVLTDEDGNAVLTALTTAQDTQMWLQWETAPPIEESSLQLWSISKRDGQVRSLAIFDSLSAATLTLNETTFRLVSDSSFLLLTREELGGSAIDEPSEELIAKGVCIRFKKPNEA